MKLRCTQLEPREMPAVITVTSNLDNLFSDNDITLREAIRVVNQGNTNTLSANEKTFVTGTLGTNDTIQFANVLNGATITVGSPGTLFIAKPVTLQGPSNLITLDGANTVRLLDINLPGTTNSATLNNLKFIKSNGSAVTTLDTLYVDGCTFKGNVASIGSAINNQDGKFTVANSTFVNNTTSGGGAIYATASAVPTDANSSTIYGSTFTNNTSRYGGALSVSGNQKVVLRSSTFQDHKWVPSVINYGYGGVIDNQGITRAVQCIFTGNVSTYGGVVNNENSFTSVECQFINNTADYGGAIYSRSSTTSIFGSLFQGNKAGEGGAINIDQTTSSTGSKLTATNSTFSSNIATNNGGAIIYNNSNYNGSGTVSQRLVNVTITGNRSREVATNTGNGGGIRIVGLKTNLQVFNSVIAGNTNKLGTNTPSDIVGTIFSSSTNNIIGDAATAAGLTNGQQNNFVGNNGTGTLPVASVLNTTLTDTGTTKVHALVQNSIAIGAGSATVPGYVAYDQRESPRGINADNPDIGAYEVQHPLTPVGVPQNYARTFQPRPSATQNEAFVKGLYQSTLLRAAEPAGLQGWLDIMNAGTMTIQQIAYGFVNSTENRRNQVTFFYRYFLSREPDTAGLNFHVNRLQGGVDEAQLMSEFILSAEYSASSTNAQFVNLMYYAILGRQADTAGYNGWLNSLNSGTSRATVVNAFVRSAEGITRIVNSYFASYLKRAASAAELNQFNVLVGTQTFGITASQILGSDEFLTAAGQNMT